MFTKPCIVPLYKKGSWDEEYNYRPVSILPAFSKVMERIMPAQMEAFLDANAVLTESHYGFRRNRSTADAALHLSGGLL